MKRKSVRHSQYVMSGESGKLKYTTRHLAALDFLQSIAMKNELSIIESGMVNVNESYGGYPDNNGATDNGNDSKEQSELGKAEVLHISNEIQFKFDHLPHQYVVNITVA